ncbi:metallophosphoesterase family protein [Actinobacillus suis]|uniref:Diadenosine tetraphosphatase n=2 Tax=Actinobacillus suis TaxID=716 RepID=K0G616_ACTSU|nr:metallophosphoesterase [Actinobacillus suis]AFU19528.1 diadenosine tetraphosphatase [Actinobacillus suis H91-0380]AIJ31666.1 diadenosine tetraphosphatase [Actinobacillus suis ATCC 33415]MCO4166377.1 metallophosphoesterase [Actinobacillus suis]MCO4168755.1 metallophosphoesterase [Actinobacillus suis]MCQ9629086.1 metallophosphoesterase [Actinobacillus suis]
MILFAGDPHGSYQHLYPILQAHKGEEVALVILGDLQLTTPEELDKLSQYCDIWFIHGNHDSKTVAAFDSIWNSEWKQRNIHGKVVDIQGVKIAGLGGVFRGHIWMPPNRPMFFDPIHYCQYCPQERIWRGGLPLRHRTSIFPSDIEALENQQADILISHEAPRPHPQGFAVINQLARKMGVSKIFHGHHHDNFDYKSINRNKACDIFNIGFRSLSDIDGNYLIVGVDDRDNR